MKKILVLPFNLIPHHLIVFYPILAVLYEIANICSSVADLKEERIRERRAKRARIRRKRGKT